MALTLRPTDLDRSPATADLEDWIVQPIGRIYQRHAPANADVTWFWSITTYVEPRAGLRTSGTAGTLDAAKAAFRATWEQWQSWAAKTGFNSGAGSSACCRRIAENRLAGRASGDGRPTATADPRPQKKSPARAGGAKEPHEAAPSGQLTVRERVV